MANKDDEMAATMSGGFGEERYGYAEDMTAVYVNGTQGVVGNFSDEDIYARAGGEGGSLVELEERCDWHDGVVQAPIREEDACSTEDEEEQSRPGEGL